MNENVLEINKSGNQYRICEIEFYLNDDKYHKDTFTHGDPIQATNGKWYMHRMTAKNPMSFKGGTYKGMDLTFGKPGQIYGGILIRSIMNIKTRTHIEGPCNCLDAILN